MIKTAVDFILNFDTYLTTLVASYGSLVYLFLFLIIFVETGLVIMPFLPGDSLIFIAGTLAATGSLNPYLLFLFLTVAAIIGDTVNYWLGRYLGEKIFARFINPAHIEKTKSFFTRYGKKTIVLARFVPIVRTFAPFVAGIGKMDYFTFLSYNIIGGISWIAIFVFSGYYFGNIRFVKDNLTAIVLLIIIISIIPAIVEYIRHKRKNNAPTQQPK
jgi:membrane-associated protein